ncbi:hypothetical protein S83_004647, partial [Arachis hypogaea]
EVRHSLSHLVAPFSFNQRGTHLTTISRAMHHPPPPRRQKHVHGPSSPTARRSSLLFCVLLCSSFRSPSSLLVVQSLRSKVQPSSP